MPTYISLCRWSQDGLREVKNSPSRLDAVKKVLEGNGGRLLHFFLTMGKYDMVVITEAPNDEAVAKSFLTIGQRGSVTTATSRAFTEEEYRSIMGAL